MSLFTADKWIIAPLGFVFLEIGFYGILVGVCLYYFPARRCVSMDLNSYSLEEKVFIVVFQEDCEYWLAITWNWFPKKFGQPNTSKAGKVDVFHNFHGKHFLQNTLILCCNQIILKMLYSNLQLGVCYNSKILSSGSSSLLIPILK